MLLADPRIDPNKPSNDGATPFFQACQNGHEQVVSLLLADPRVDPNEPKKDQRTPLWKTSEIGHYVVVRHLLASGRDIDTRRKYTFNNRTAAEQARAIGGRTLGPMMKRKRNFKFERNTAPPAPTLLMSTSAILRL